LPDKLHFALIRASGCNPNAEEAAAIIAQWPPSHELRGNPAAKRALWPRLRALRRKPSP
jgi:DNA polymerase III psi subunit